MISSNYCKLQDFNKKNIDFSSKEVHFMVFITSKSLNLIYFNLKKL